MAGSRFIQGCLLSSPAIVSEVPNLSASPDVFVLLFEDTHFDSIYFPGKDKRQTVSQVKEEGGGKTTNSHDCGVLCFV